MTNPQVVLIVKALERFVEKKVKAVTLNATANLIEDTPRKTGWARANYVPSIGKASTATAGTREKVSTAMQEAGIASVVTGYKLSRGRVFISNNVPYLIFLNDGSSQQAPAMFIQAALARAVRQTFTEK